MSTEPLHDEDYVSHEDSDFAPDNAATEESSVSDNDEPAETEKQTQSKRRREGAINAADDAGFENSGDEAVIEKGKRRRKKAKRKDEGAGEDEGGEGGLIKTRSMRAVEKAEKRTEAASGPVTIDVDALWAQMTVKSGGRNQQEPATTQPRGELAELSSPPKPKLAIEKPEESDLIRIKRTYNFAGKVHTEEKLVSRDSAEAKLYLAENGGESTSADGDSQKRMPRKAFRSAFEPIAIEGVSRRSDLSLGMSDRLRAREAKEADAKKLNTVEKSRMDWAGFVDREGIKDELELAGKSKDSFAARQDFLARSEALREDEARRLRMAGKT
ncbi:bucentaur or craniofacial development-domain-containing protein [Chaetomium tenue]|uniref:Bucentaur or craniofacial development-domain-containing protein n=1 Tax=Chaetomium tenue TaxID=1854479 RepID=A0ACB7P4G9_9PEZI|nr:bucentaur or craniofacial development-domain-containing protein [Chaetomium globosum]